MSVPPSPTGPPAPPAGGPPQQLSTEFAWKVHGQLDTWTGRVDSKASFTLAIQTATLGFIVTLTGAGRRFDHLEGSAAVAFWIGLALVLAALVCSALVVMPRLRRRKLKHEWRTNFIFFGHLRFWDPLDLAAKLPDGDPDVSQLSLQLVNMAKIAWTKHVLLQGSMVLLLTAFLCFGLAAAL